MSGSANAEVDLREVFAGIARAVFREELAKLTVATKQDDYLSTRDAARFADVSTGTVRRWIREGRLPRHRAGRLVRVRRSELARMIETCQRGSDAVTDETPEGRARRMFG